MSDVKCRTKSIISSLNREVENMQIQERREGVCFIFYEKILMSVSQEKNSNGEVCRMLGTIALHRIDAWVACCLHFYKE